MNSSNLAKAGLKLTPLCLGCEQLGGTDWGKVDFNDLYAVVARAWERGIRVFDTADVYGLGRSELQLREALGDKRHEALIVSKFGMRWDTAKSGERARVYRDASPGYMVKALEGSLKRLDIDAIPLYLLHWPDVNTPLEETLDALEQCKKAGKIRAYGLSNFEWKQYESLLNSYPVAALQGKYSLIDQMPGKLDYIAAHGAGLEVLTYGPLAQGLLSGKYDEKSRFGSDDRRYRLPQFLPNAWPRNARLLKVLHEAAKFHDKTPAQVALRWIIEQDIVSSVVVGAKTPTQIESNIGALGWQLDPSWVERLTRAAGDRTNDF